MSVERAWEDAAYFAALLVWLVEHKNDNEADEEIGMILKDKPWLTGLIVPVLQSCK